LDVLGPCNLDKVARECSGSFALQDYVMREVNPYGQIGVSHKDVNALTAVGFCLATRSDAWQIFGTD